jgi:hypothetical protein
MSTSLLLRRVLGIALAAAPTLLPAQSAPVTKLDFSGIMFGAYSYRTNAGAQNTNRFDLERVYLNFRMPVAERLSVRITPDISPQVSGTGYVYRLKFAFLQLDRPANAAGYSGFVRAGALQTATIEHHESFWPRWMGTSPVERWGYFSSADVGVSGQVNLPKKKGEFYAAVTNGNGYANPETDRFKSIAARLTLTPLMNGKHGVWTTLSISPWIDINKGASKFVNGGAGQTGAVGEGLTKNRYGIWAGIKDPNLSIAGGWSQRIDGVESGANTAASPRTVADVTGRLLTGLAVIRPFQLADAKSKAPLSLLFRYDAGTPNTDLDQSNHLFEASLIFDIAGSRKAQVAFDFQENLGDVPAATVAPDKRFQVRLTTSF